MAFHIFPLRLQYANGGLQHQLVITTHIRIVLPILGDDLIMAVDRYAPSDAEIDVIVFTGSQGSIEFSDKFKDLPPVHHGCVHPNVIATQ